MEGGKHLIHQNNDLAEAAELLYPPKAGFKSTVTWLLGGGSALAKASTAAGANVESRAPNLLNNNNRGYFHFQEF